MTRACVSVGGLRGLGPAGAVRALADADRGREVLRQTIPEFHSGAWRLVSYELTGVWKTLGKYVVVCRISYRNGTSPHTLSADIAAKLYRRDHGARGLRALRWLWEAGFRPPARYRVPRPFGYSPERRALLQAFAPGTPWADFLWSDPRGLSQVSARAADWLLRLQQTALQAEAEGPEHDAARVQRYARKLAARFPRCAQALAALAERLIPSLQSQDLPLVPSHGDYHPGNVLLTSKSTTVIDHDHFGLREAAFDAGYAIGQLLIMSYFRTGDFAMGARAASGFWRRYALEGKATWRRVAIHVARTFLQSLHYELCVLLKNRDNRVELLDLWPRFSEQWLESNGPATLENLVRRR